MYIKYMMVKEAVILSGGSGTRLRSVTQNKIPKAMTKIKGLSILEWQLQWLSREGVSHVILAIGHLSDQIQSLIGDSYSSKYGDMKISYSVETEKLGTGGAFKLASNLIVGNECFILNGDVLCDSKLSEMVQIHFSNNANATMMLVNMTSPYGIVSKNEHGIITGFLEKPRLKLQINGGLSIMTRELFERCPDKGQLEDTIYVEMTQNQKFYSFSLPNEKFWMSIDTEKDYIMANESWNGV